MHLKLTNGTPAKYTLGDLRRDNPNTSFPKHIPDDLLASYDVYPYTRPTPGEYDKLAWRLVDGNFEQDSVGNWSLPYVLEALPLEQAQSNIRNRRDGLLKDTDWIIIKAYERNENIPAVWELYRQQLRDITAQQDFPYQVSWPTKPE